MTIDNKLKKCNWVVAFNSQKARELKDYGNLNGLSGYISKGCDKCNGYKTDCYSRLTR